MASPVARWSTPFIVSNNFGVFGPSVTAIPSPDAGIFVVAWTDSGDSLGLGDGSGQAIYGQLYNEDGSANGTPFLINTTTSGDQLQPIVIDRTTDEGFAVAWRDFSSGVSDVRMRLFNPDGSAEGNDFVVNAGGPTVAANQFQPSIARGSAFGNIFVTWSDGGGAPDGDGADIRGRLFDNNSNPVATDFRITTVDHTPAETGSQFQSNVAALPDTGFVVTWADDVGAGSAEFGGEAIRGQLYNFTGAAVGSEFTIASGGTSDALLSRPVSAGISASGGPGPQFLTAWVQDDDASSSFDFNVHARVFSIDGLGNASGGSVLTLSESTAGQQTQMVVATYLSIGGIDPRFIAVWTDQQPAQGPTVHARMFDLDGNPVTDEFIVNPEFTGTSHELASVTVLNDTIGGHPMPRFVVTWKAVDGTMRGQIFDPNASELLGIDWFGSDRDETYTAQYDEHVLAGNGGNDNLTGSAIADTLRGNANNDVLFGLAGIDILDGGLGQDDLTGGDDGDIFDFNLKQDSVKGANRDVIMDFSGVMGGQLDVINLAGIDAKKGGGNQKFKYIGGAKFHHKAGELQVKYNADTDIAIVQGDIDGNGKADFQIEVHSLTALVKGDFIL